MSVRNRALACVLGLISTFALGTGATYATTVLSDGTFTNVSVVGVLADPGVTAAGSVCGACGTSNGAGLNSHFEFSNAGTGRVGFVDNLLGYDPSVLGPIASLNISLDRQTTIQYIGTATTANNNAFVPIIVQNSTPYLVSPPLLSGSHIFNVPGTSTYDTLSATGLTAGDFLEYDPVTGTFLSGHPDFTTGVILFGLANRSTFGSVPPSGIVVDANFDNLTIELSQTPIPGALPLFASGAGLIGLLVRRKRRNVSVA
jgi:hypothetical protein